MAVPGAASGLVSRKPLHYRGKVVLSLLINTHPENHTCTLSQNMYLHCIYLCLCACDYIQVEALADDEVVGDPVYVTINVLDVNNNAPYFNQSSYTAVVRERNPAGVCY